MDKRKEINKVVRESLSEALIYYMKIKPFQEITVTELINKAGVARATYYRNFDSKEDLAREYLSNRALEIAAFGSTSGEIDSYEKILSTWECLERYKGLYILYSKAGLSELLLDTMTDKEFYHLDPENWEEMDELKFTAFTGAFYNVVRKWIMEGAKTPAEEMAKLFANIWHNR